MRTAFRSFIAIALSVPATAFSVVPATAEQVLCSASHVVVATVLRATPRDCRNELKQQETAVTYCAPKDMANLLILVTELLGRKEIVAKFPRDVGIRMGAEVEVTTALFNSLHYPSTEYLDRIGVIPPTDQPLSEKAISDIFEGRQFVFSIHVRLGDALIDGQIHKDYLDFPPFYAGVWRMEKKSWIIDYLKGKDGIMCPNPVAITTQH